jgi:hypothetical protein
MEKKIGFEPHVERVGVVWRSELALQSDMSFLVVCTF